MMLITRFLEWYHYYNVEIADKRTRDWTLVSSPMPMIFLSGLYLYFVLRYGPRYMKNKQPYKLLGIIRAYNVFQIMSNAFIVYLIFDAGWVQDFFTYCYEARDSMHPNSYKIASVIWWTYLLKVFDYIETCIFVFRKKESQISFLHLYHHVSTASLGWIYSKYWIRGMSMTVIMVNCSIHIAMYTYYLLSSFGSRLQAYLQPIKPLITIAQMVQFVTLIIYLTQCLFPYCSQHRIPALIMIVDLVANFVLFYNFFKRTYGPKKNKTE